MAKISDIIARVNTLKPSNYPTSIKLDWINDVDGMVWNELYKYTGFLDVLRKQNQISYSLPYGVKFEDVTNVFVDGIEIYLISYRDFETTGYYRDSSGKLAIYPVPSEDDATPGLRMAYNLPFIPHSSVNEDTYISRTPFDKTYDDYCFAMIDKFNQDDAKYQNSMAFFNESFNAYRDWYVKQEA